MGILVLGDRPGLVSLYLSELRDKTIQQDRLRFRTNIKRISYILAYEAAKFLDYKPLSVETPLGTAEEYQLCSEPIIISVMRAGLPMHEAFLQMFDKAENAFIAAYRNYTNPEASQFAIKTEYVASPPPNQRTWIFVDPMIATGNTIEQAYQHLIQLGAPEKIIICGIVASAPGVAHLQQILPQANILVAALDKILNHKAYIVPGLGDAGDLAFGSKWKPLTVSK